MDCRCGISFAALHDLYPCILSFQLSRCFVPLSLRVGQVAGSWPVSGLPSRFCNVPIKPSRRFVSPMMSLTDLVVVCPCCSCFLLSIGRSKVWSQVTPNRDGAYFRGALHGWLQYTDVLPWCWPLLWLGCHLLLLLVVSHFFCLATCHSLAMSFPVSQCTWDAVRRRNGHDNEDWRVHFTATSSTHVLEYISLVAYSWGFDWQILATRLSLC